jgi:beta-lactamase class C
MTVSLDKALGIAEGWVRDGVVPGVSVAVARHGELVATRAAGKKSAGGGGPVDESTLYSIASLTKPFTAAAALRLVERGELSLDEPLRRLVRTLPGERRDLMLRDLLRHTAGLLKDDPAELELWEREATFDETVASAAAAPPLEEPGLAVRYSNLGYWIAGGAIAAAAGGTFADVLRAEVLGPFGLTDVVIQPDESLSPRIARRYGRAKIMNAPYGRELGSPGGGLFATATDLVRFASVFLASGTTPEGTRVLGPASVALMTTDQTGGLPGGIPDLREWPVCPWALGWEIKGPKREHWTGDLTSPATFAHPGQSGCLLWGDPATGIAVAVLANRDLSTGWTVAPARWARLNNAIVAALTAGE